MVNVSILVLSFRSCRNLSADYWTSFLQCTNHILLPFIILCPQTVALKDNTVLTYKQVHALSASKERAWIMCRSRLILSVACLFLKKTNQFDHWVQDEKHMGPEHSPLAFVDHLWWIGAFFSSKELLSTCSDVSGERLGNFTWDRKSSSVAASGLLKILIKLFKAILYSCFR